MPFNAEDLSFFKLALLDKLVTKADRVIRPQIPSRRLRQAMRKTFDISQTRRAKGALFIPHYWAVMVHDGTRAFGPKSAQFLVYFANEDDDPRGPSPERASDERRLTRDEFNAGMQRNRDLEIQNPGGGPMQHMIVVKSPRGRPARVGAKAGTPFFSKGGEAFERQVDDLVFRELDAFVKKNVPTDSQTARFFI
jgi:hypothetical protein